MVDRNLAVVCVHQNRYLVYRAVGNIVLVDVVDGKVEQPPTVVATSSAGCRALGEALIEMSEKIRDIIAEECG